MPSNANTNSSEGSLGDESLGGESLGDEATHGVGPWPGGPEAWPTGDQWDPELLANGDSRNVVDGYRYWRMEAIVADLDTRRHDFHVAIENWQHDMNIGSIVRTANAFGAKAVHIVGKRRWNKRGAMVTDRYQHVHHHETIEDLLAWASDQGLPVIAIDNSEGFTPLESFTWPRGCVMLFGQEGPGVSAEGIAAAQQLVGITQYGSTRSMNAGAAAAVTMYSWCVQHAK